jgi:hypothetical protein
MPEIQSDEIKHSYYSTAIKKLITWETPETLLVGDKNPNFAKNPISESLKNKEVIIANQFIELIKNEGPEALKRNFATNPLPDAPELSTLLAKKGRYTLFYRQVEETMAKLGEKLASELNPAPQTAPAKPDADIGTAPLPLTEVPDKPLPDAIDRIVNTLHDEPLEIGKNKFIRLPDREAFANFKANDGTIGIDRLIYHKIGEAGITEPDEVTRLANTLAVKLVAAYNKHPLLQARTVKKPRAGVHDSQNVIFTLPEKTDPLYAVFPDSPYQDRGKKLDEQQGASIELEEGGQATRKIYNTALAQTVSNFDFNKAISKMIAQEKIQTAAPVAEVPSDPAAREALIKWGFQQENAEWIAGILKAEQAPLRTNNAPRQNYANATINSVFEEYKAKLERNPQALSEMASRYSNADRSAPSPVIEAAEKMGVVEPALPRCLSSHNR